MNSRIFSSSDRDATFRTTTSASSTRFRSGASSCASMCRISAVNSLQKPASCVDVYSAGISLMRGSSDSFWICACHPRTHSNTLSPTPCSRASCSASAPRAITASTSFADSVSGAGISSSTRCTFTDCRKLLTDRLSSFSRFVIFSSFDSVSSLRSAARCVTLKRLTIGATTWLTTVSSARSCERLSGTLTATTCSLTSRPASMGAPTAALHSTARMRVVSVLLLLFSPLPSLLLLFSPLPSLSPNMALPSAVADADVDVVADAERRPN